MFLSMGILIIRVKPLWFWARSMGHRFVFIATNWAILNGTVVSSKTTIKMVRYKVVVLEMVVVLVVVLADREVAVEVTC